MCLCGSVRVCLSPRDVRLSDCVAASGALVWARQMKAPCSLNCDPGLRSKYVCCLFCAPLLLPLFSLVTLPPATTNHHHTTTYLPHKHQQIDLSDDYVLFMMFADNNWEQEIVPIQLADENGRASTLEMGEQQFKDYVGILKTLSEAEAAAREAVAQQGAGGGVAVGEDGAIDVTASEVRVPSNDTS